MLVADTETRVKKANQEISFSVLLKQKKSFQGLFKNDLLMDVTVSGKYERGDTYQEPFRQIQRHNRTLTCSNSGYFCEPLIVFKQRYIVYPYYQVTIRFLNVKELYESGFFEDVLFTKFEYTNTEYTAFETTVRAIFLIMSSVVSLFYIVSLLYSQQWSYCKTEQKWIALLLVALNLFNNPFFIAEWTANHWFFPLLNIVFQSTFAAIFLLFILVMTHSALVAPNRRTFLSFYFPKIFLVSILWILITLVFSWERFNEVTDPTIHLTDIPFFGPLRIIIGLIGTILLLQVLFNMVRAVTGGENVARNMNETLDDPRGALDLKSSTVRFKMFFILTFFLLLIVAADFISFVLFDYANHAAQYLSLLPLVNYYGILLAIFFLPSNEVDNSGQAVIAPELFKIPTARSGRQQQPSFPADEEMHETEMMDSPRLQSFELVTNEQPVAEQQQSQQQQQQHQD